MEDLKKGSSMDKIVYWQKEIQRKPLKISKKQRKISIKKLQKERRVKNLMLKRSFNNFNSILQKCLWDNMGIPEPIFMRTV